MITKVPPSNQRDRVPLGSSSASMYPGYSPADHIYGNAAMEAGAAAAAAKKAGLALKPPVDIEYEIGQAKGIKRKKLVDMRAAKGSQGGNGSGSGSGADTPARAVNGHGQEVKAADTKKAETKPAAEASESEQPAFFVDIKPTPVNLPFTIPKPSKRQSPKPEPTEQTTPKKIKKKHDGDTPVAPKPGQIETEDISAEVDKRMKEKEERRKRKEEQKKEKKRKRETEDPSSVAAGASSTVAEAETPKKKKSKKDHNAKEAEEASKKRPADDQVAGDDGEGKTKKRKKHQEEAEASAKKTWSPAKALRSMTVEQIFHPDLSQGLSK